MQIRVNENFLDSPMWEDAVQRADNLEEFDREAAIYRRRSLACVQSFLEASGVEYVYLNTQDLRALGIEVSMYDKKGQKL